MNCCFNGSHKYVSCECPVSCCSPPVQLSLILEKYCVARPLSHASSRTLSGICRTAKQNVAGCVGDVSIGLARHGGVATSKNKHIYICSTEQRLNEIILSRLDHRRSVSSMFVLAQLDLDEPSAAILAQARTCVRATVAKDHNICQW